MKKLSLWILLLMVSVIVSAQKMTIKAGNGKTIEVSCEGGLTPKEISVAPDGTVTFKMENGSASEQAPPQAEPMCEETDSVDTFVEVTDSLETGLADNDSIIVAATDSLKANSLVSDSVSIKSDYGQQTVAGFIANSLAEELSPEYAEFEKEHENTHPGTERELTKRIAKQFINEEDVENADLLLTLFSNIRFTKDSTFVPTYPQRKAKPLWRSFDVVELSGSLGKDITSISDATANAVNEDDYGDDTENHNKFGGGIKFSHTYMKGSLDEDGKWHANTLGFALSWGALISYSYEKEIGSYLNIMGKAGIQIGNDICIGVDALIGSGLTPYNTFLTDEMNYNTINKSVWCFKYGVEAWGSLNFSRDTYTAIFGRYITSTKPNGGSYNLSKDWEVVLEDFDPSSWTVGLAVGYKFGAPEPLKQDKRLRAGLITGYQITGGHGFVVATELERLTQVSKSTNLSYGLMTQNVFNSQTNGGNCSSIMLTGGFEVCQPGNKFFWGTKLLAGIGEYPITDIGYADNYYVENVSKKPCAKAGLQLSAGLKLGKLSSISAIIRAGGHYAKALNFENFNEDSKTRNALGFDMMTGLNYSFIF